MTSNFALRRGAAITERYDPAPEDPLGELTAVEMGLQRFCFDHDCRVTVEVGAAARTVFLYFDISIILDDFPGVISQVAASQKAVLPFPESSFDLKFVPSSEGLTCTLSEFGSAVRQTTIEVSQGQAFEELRRFYMGIIEQAVALGYVEALEGQRLLAELPETIGRL